MNEDEVGWMDGWVRGRVRFAWCVLFFVATEDAYDEGIVRQRTWKIFFFWGKERSGKYGYMLKFDRWGGGR